MAWMAGSEPGHDKTVFAKEIAQTFAPLTLRHPLRLSRRKSRCVAFVRLAIASAFPTRQDPETASAHVGARENRRHRTRPYAGCRRTQGCCPLLGEAAKLRL